MSGGKDSTALACFLLRTLPRESLRFVFADTRWEAPETYAYLDEIERVLRIRIERVSGEGMRAATLRHATFPSRTVRWCTDELKMRPIKAWLESQDFGDEFQMAVGIRAEESEARAKMPEREWSAALDCETWRPMLAWSQEDVIREITNAGLTMNPLYLKGYNRVGCFPCVYASKAELARIGEDRPERFAGLQAIEDELAELRAERNREKPGRYKRERVTMFIERDGSQVNARDLLKWAKSSRYAEQGAPREGCMRWGFCEAAQ